MLLIKARSWLEIEIERERERESESESGSSNPKSDKWLPEENTSAVGSIIWSVCSERCSSHLPATAFKLYASQGKSLRVIREVERR